MAVEEKGAHLAKSMGLPSLVLFYVTAVVGPRWIARAASDGGASGLTIWLIAFVAFFIPLAFAVIELSSRYPEEGGIYVWSKRAFGEFSGFLTGWTYWTSNLIYLPGLLYFSASNALYIFGDETYAAHEKDATYFVLFSLVGLAVAVGLNLVGLRIGKWLHNVGAIGTWIPIGILVAAGFVAWAKFGSATTFTPSTVTPSTNLDAIIFWSSIAFGFAGLESASLMADEIEDARRTIPRGIVVGGLIVTAIYLLGTLAILLALPQSEVSGLAGIMQAITKTGDRVGLHGIGPLCALLISVSGIGGVGAWLAAAGRLPFVAGIDNFLPKAFAKIHPTWKTPYVALLVQGAVAAVVVVLSQAGESVTAAYDILVKMGIISAFIPYLFLFAALAKVQSEVPGPGVFRVPGGRPVATLAAILGFLVTLGSIVLSLVPDPTDEHQTETAIRIVGGCAALVVAGIVVYALGVRRRRVAEALP